MAGEESLGLLIVSAQSLVTCGAAATAVPLTVIARQESRRRKVENCDMLFPASSPLHPGGHAFGAPHGPQQIQPSHFLDFALRVAAPRQLRQQRGILGDILQPGRRTVETVEVRADADVNGGGHAREKSEGGKRGLHSAAADCVSAARFRQEKRWEFRVYAVYTPSTAGPRKRGTPNGPQFDLQSARRVE